MDEREAVRKEGEEGPDVEAHAVRKASDESEREAVRKEGDRQAVRKGDDPDVEAHMIRK
jgi:hypothetical protein